jgi:hypothetical protein
MAGTMRRVVAGSKSEGERQRRQSVRQELVEVVEGVGISTGGFAGAGSVSDRMSPGLRGAIAQAEAVEAYEAAQEQRRHSARVAQFQERSEEAARQIAIQEALAAGEDASPRALRGERLGHTHGEFVALMSARMDVEDMQLEAAKWQAMRRWEAQYDAGQYADVSAPSARQLEEEDRMQERMQAVRRDNRLLQRARQHTEEVAREIRSKQSLEAGSQYGYRTTYTP